jgi:hypothetical protein
MAARLRTLAAILLLALGPQVGQAAIPDPAFSTLDGDLMLGNARGLAVPLVGNVRPTVADGYRVIVRDLFGVPIPNSVVTLDFTGSGVRPHALQRDGSLVDCVGERILRGTNPAGGVIFFPATVGIGSVPGPSVEIRADGVLLGVIRFRSIDLATAPGLPARVDLQDLAEMRLRYFNLGGESNLDPETDFATEGPSAGITDGFDVNVLRLEILCGNAGAPIPLPCETPICP